MKKRKTNNKGFSLVELIIVVAIMAVLIGILAPQYLRYVEKSRLSADNDYIDSVRKACEAIAADPSINLSADTYTLTISATGISDDSGDSTMLNELAKTVEVSGTNLLKSKEYTKSSGAATPKVEVDFTAADGPRVISYGYVTTPGGQAVQKPTTGGTNTDTH